MPIGFCRDTKAPVDCKKVLVRVGGKIAKLQLHKAKAAGGTYTVGFVTKSNQRLNAVDVVLWSEISIGVMKHPTYVEFAHFIHKVKSLHFLGAEQQMHFSAENEE